MDVVRHDDVGVELLLREGAFAEVQGIDDDLRDALVAEPRWAGLSLVENAIDLHEGSTVCRGVAVSVLPEGVGERSEQSPGYEDGGCLRLLVGQLPAIERH